MAAVKYPDINYRPLTISPELGKNPCFNSSTVMLNTYSVPPLIPREADHPRRWSSETTTLEHLHPTDCPWKLNPTAPEFFPRRRPVQATKLLALEPSAKVQTPTLAKVKPTSRHPYPRDALDDLVDNAANALKDSTSWKDFFLRQRDDRNDWGAVEELQHDARHLLTHYKKHGVPVVMHGKPWNKGQKAAALERGPHQSAKEHIPFLREEFCDMIEKGHWVLLPADLVIDRPELRLSPCGVVPQHDRRPRTISDYSFLGVNDDTAAMAPREAMQFGRALPRILQTIHEANPRYGPVYMSTVDIADGFYRMGLRPDDALRLGMLFPTRKGEPRLIAIPLVLPMGWKESPPSFCSATETVADVANDVIKHQWPTTSKSHRLDALAETPIGNPIASVGPPALPSKTATHVTRPVHQWDIYVDDFLGLAQGKPATRLRVKRALFQSLDKVFRPLSPDDNPMRQEPVSVKKLKKGDATWATTKRMLGWNIDSVKGTIALTPRRRERLLAILNTITPNQCTVPTKLWHKVLGELRSMAIALPGARGLFSLLQEAFRHEDLNTSTLTLTPQVHAMMADLRHLAVNLTERPTRIAELVPSQPTVIGACDASGLGMGGVFFAPDSQGRIIPHLWRQRFSPEISAALVTYDNPTGTVNNSDLELCGNICHHDVVAQTVDIREKTIGTLSDNVASVFWLRKGSTTTTKPPAYLLRLQAFHQRHHRYVPRHDYIPGESNVMADKASRAWDLVDSQLVTFFNREYPQTEPWRLCQLLPETNSAVTSALSVMRCDTRLIEITPTARMPTGSSGSNFAPLTNWIPFLPINKILSPTSKSLPNVTEMGGWPLAVNASHLNTFRTFSPRWARTLPGWGPKTPGTRTTMAN